MRSDQKIPGQISYKCIEKVSRATPIHHCTKAQVSSFEHLHATVLKLQHNKRQCLFDLVTGINSKELSIKNNCSYLKLCAYII